MNPIIKKENININYVHKTQEATERSKSQNKNPKSSNKIKSSRPSFVNKKDNINNGLLKAEGNTEDKQTELKNENNNQMNLATEIADNDTATKVKEENQNQSFLNDFNLNIKVNDSLNTKKTNDNNSIEEYEVEDSQRFIIKSKKNNFIKNNQSHDQKIQSISNNGGNSNQNNPIISKVAKSNPLKIRQRSNSPTILKMQGQQQISYQNRIISANLHSKAVALAQQNVKQEFKINCQNLKRKDQEDASINSCEDSITSNFQKDNKIKQFQAITKPIAQLQYNKKKMQKGSVDVILSSNNSSDAEVNEDTSKDRRVKSISMTPGIAYHNQFNLKESQHTFDALESSNITNASEKRKSMESENKLPRINRLNMKQKETTLYNQLRESNQKNALELPSIIDNIKQNVNSCENLFKNRLKDRIGGVHGQFQQASASSILKNKETELNQYDFDADQGNNHEQFDKAIIKNQQKQGKEQIPTNLLNQEINQQNQVESGKKREFPKAISNRQNAKDDSSLKQESPNHIFKYIRQSQQSEQKDQGNRRDSSISYKQSNNSQNGIQQSIQVRNRIKSEHNVMQNNSSGNYPSEKLITEDSEGEPNSTADRKKLKKLNQINKYLKNKMDMQKQIISQIGSAGGNSVPVQNNGNVPNGNQSNSTQKTQPHKQVPLQIQQQQLLQISKNQQIALSNQKQQNQLNGESNNETQNSQSPQLQSIEQPLSNKNQQYQKGVIEVLDQALYKRKEDKVNKSISQQIEKEIDKLNILTSKSSTARDEQLRIQEDLIKYNLKMKLNKMKIVDTVFECLQEEQ